MAIPSDIAFTPTVKAIQTARGSRSGYAQMEQKRGWATNVTEDLAACIDEMTSFYLATANAAGQPYIQHRGGPATGNTSRRATSPRTIRPFCS